MLRHRSFWNRRGSSGVMPATPPESVCAQHGRSGAYRTPFHERSSGLNLDHHSFRIDKDRPPGSASLCSSSQAQSPAICFVKLRRPSSKLRLSELSALGLLQARNSKSKEQTQAVLGL